MTNRYKQIEESIPRSRGLIQPFFRSKEAGHQSAAIYTIVENCGGHGVPVEAYATQELFTRLPPSTDAETIATLTPARIVTSRRREPAAV